MTNDEMAHSYLQTAAYALKEAHRASADGVWHLAARRSQECVEMALKALLRLIGLEVPKVHDGGFLLRQHKTVFPTWFQEQLDRLNHISRNLRKDREVSLYGDEVLNLSAQEIFSEVDAREALKDAGFVLESITHLFEELRRATNDQPDETATNDHSAEAREA